MKFIAQKRIYLDYASLTPIDPRVISVMKQFSSGQFANPSSLYREGVAAKKALQEGRKQVADFLHAHADEIIFTSGGTESNNLAIRGVVSAAQKSFAEKKGTEKPHLIISFIEHSSIIEVTDELEKQGIEVTKLPVDKGGLISIEDLKKSLKPNTCLVSIMTVNNEIGTIQPIKEVAKVVRQFRTKLYLNAADSNATRAIAYPLFHTDAAQAALYEDLNMEKVGVDLLTLDGSKVYGPRGIGALYLRRGVQIEPIIFGGGQEAGLRSGTENLPAVMGFAKALELATGGEEKSKEKERGRIAELRSYFIEELKKIRADVIINGINGASDAHQSPHILNVSIPGIDNEFFVLKLDAAGIASSTKSSCLRDADESYVLKAIGADSKTSVRFSFGRWTTRGDLNKTIRAISKILAPKRKGLI